MTERVLKAIENPCVRILGHPTGRLLLRREPFAIDMAAVLRRAAELGVAMEQNAAPERLDLNDRDLRLAKEAGCKIVMSSDSHDSRNLGKMDYGLKQLRRAWLTAADVLNTRDAKGFLGRCGRGRRNTVLNLRRWGYDMNERWSTIRRKRMTTVQINLPDRLAQEAQRAGLLSSEFLEKCLREELKAQRVYQLFSAMDRMSAVNDPAILSPEAVAEEIAAMRAERRAQNNG